MCLFLQLVTGGPRHIRLVTHMGFPCNRVYTFLEVKQLGRVGHVASMRWFDAILGWFGQNIVL
jgi:hypothetical protein